jgi:hypothetical protein
MNTFLTLLDRVAPRLTYYPRWARLLFAIAFGSLLISVFVYVAAAPNAQARLRSKLALAATLANQDLATLHASLMHVPASKAFDSPLLYQETLEGKTAVVTPDSAYLRLLARGGPLIGVADYSNEWNATDHPPVLEVELANTSHQTISASQVIVDVKRSRPDLVAVPVVFDLGLEARRTLAFSNEGWGTGAPVAARFALAPEGSRPRWNDEPHRLSFPRGLSRHISINLDSVLSREGVDVAYLRLVERKSSRYDKKRVRVALGRFDLSPRTRVSSAVCYGQISYRLPGGATHTVRFITHVIVFTLVQAIAPPVEEAQTYAVKLRASGDDYNVAVPIDEEVKPGEAIRFGLSILADRSSTHDFRIRVVTANGVELSSQRFLLRIFSPRSRPFRRLVPKLRVRYGSAT